MPGNGRAPPCLPGSKLPSERADYASGIRECSSSSKSWEQPRNDAEYTQVSRPLYRGCPNEEEGYLLPTVAWKNNLPTFRLNAPVVIRAKVKEVRTKHYYL